MFDVKTNQLANNLKLSLWALICYCITTHDAKCDHTL